MKIYVSVDMEGISGIILREQLMRGEPLYSEARHLLTREVNAIVEGLLEAGVEQIVVKDAHATGFNFIPENLHPGAMYCMGGTPMNERFPGLDSSFDGAMLIGYHGMAGTPRAVRDHTMSSATYQRTELNGNPVGEIVLDAMLFGLHNVPVLLVTGDDATCREAEQALGSVHTYETKTAITRHSALIKPPQRVHSEIKKAVQQAVEERGICRPLAIPGPYELLLEMNSTDLADSRYTDGETSIRLDGLRILYKDDDYVRLLGRAMR
ncbi:M55 family metallopeptidase [Paenibacillus sp. J2TS4]|uniref:M55 family metallopeptidase n=1 Tax=Paenibacillus sp. J2TS4 TaxID=2807194 RepID=UPI001B0A6655|nr:M55 family metallopeptidase [Paenibacillus sp. J2TS4]GIP36154.1 D-aminopeptidase DppA [Paenibacillus sp. J2TS4]